ncbi:MAG: hypothetical protein PHX82_14285, partial [Paracoccaceae bacterium]|nr:hypothetical protein [Paracoccaceae bacterium]
LNRVVGRKSGRSGLHIFALGQEFSSRTESSNAVIGPTNVVFRVDSSHGAHRVPAVVPDGDPIFITRDKRRLVQISYSFQDDANRALDLSRAAQHLGAEGFEEVVWQSSPQRMGWLRRGSGDLAPMLHEPGEDVLGWATHPVAGGFVCAMAVTPALEAGADTVMIAVERVIDGATVCMVEELANVHAYLTGEADPFEACHLFSSVRIDAPEGATVISVPHLVGQSVYAWTDGGEYGPILVGESGEVTLAQPATTGVVGLFDHTHYAETLDVQAAGPTGDTSGRKRRLTPGVGISMLRTSQGYLRAVERDLGAPDRLREPRPIVPRQVSADLSVQVSGIGSVDVTCGMSDAISLRIEPHGGAPLTITGLVPTITGATR